jgi:hypothetical protein
VLALQRITDSQDGLVTLAQCRELGITREQVRWLLRRSAWRLITRGVYLVDADIRPAPDLRTMIRAGYLSTGGRAVVVLQSAALLHGLQGLFPDQLVRLNLPGDQALAKPLGVDLARLLPYQLTLLPGEIVEVGGVRVTSVARTLADLILSVDRYSAVSVLDNALFQGLIGESDLDQVHRSIAGRRGAVSAREWLGQIDARAESPLETRARLRCADGGVAPDELQAEIFGERGELIARVDMLWRRFRLVGELDGARHHDTPEALFRDRERQNALVNAGFRVLRFTWQDTLTPDAIPRAVREAMSLPVAR